MKVTDNDELSTFFYLIGWIQRPTSWLDPSSKAPFLRRSIYKVNKDGTERGPKNYKYYQFKKDKGYHYVTFATAEEIMEYILNDYTGI